MTDERDIASNVLGPHWPTKLAIARSMFPQQVDLHYDPAQFRACHAGRRGGKSDGMPKSSALDVLDAGPNEDVVIGAETLKKAKALHWENLRAVVRQFNLPLTPNGQDDTWVAPWGARIRFWGLNDAGAVELLRGLKLKAARFDECATIAGVLPRLVEHVLEPALGDTGGSLTLYGTPSVTRAGPWFEICAGSEAHKWSVKHWDARANPHFRADRGGAEAWFQEVLKRNGWDWNHPTFQREYLGLFVDDHTRMVVEYKRDRDGITELPADYSAAWRHVAGVDYGYNDAFAIVVVAMDPYEPARRLKRFARKAHRITYDEAADMLKSVLKQFECQHVACDPAGGGKPFYETFNARYGGEVGVNVTSAHKVAGSLVESIRFQNTELRTGRLQVYLPEAQALADEWQALPWKDDWRDAVDDAFPQDCFDAGRYALMETIAWEPKPRPTQESKDAKLERELMMNAARKASLAASPMERLKERW